MRKCSGCGGALVRATKEQTRVVLGTSFIVKAPAFSCRSCREVFVPGDSLETVDLEIAAHLAMSGSFSRETFRFMRKALGMRGFELAKLFLVTGETVSRWEHGQRSLDPHAWVLLGSIVLERLGRPVATLRRLVSLQKPAKLPKTVKLEAVAVKPRASKPKARTARVA